MQTTHAHARLSDPISFKRINVARTFQERELGKRSVMQRHFLAVSSVRDDSAPDRGRAGNDRDITGAWMDCCRGGLGRD